MKDYSIVERRSFEEQQQPILCLIESLAMKFLEKSNVFERLDYFRGFEFFEIDNVSFNSSFETLFKHNIDES